MIARNNLVGANKLSLPNSNSSRFAWFALAVFIAVSLTVLSLEFAERNSLISDVTESVCRFVVIGLLMCVLVGYACRDFLDATARRTVIFCCFAISIGMGMEVIEDVESLNWLPIVGGDSRWKHSAEKVVLAAWTCGIFYLLFVLLRSLESRYSLLQKETNERRHAEQVIHAIAEGTATTVGTDFFHSLVRCLSSTLDVRCAIVAECFGCPTRQSRTLAVWDQGRLGPPFEFDLAGTPCAETIANGSAYYRDNVQGTFPEADFLRKFEAESYNGLPLVNSHGQGIGWIAVLDDRATGDLTGLPALKIFASRAAAELERIRAQADAKRHLAEMAHAARLHTMGEMVAGLAHELNQPLTAIGNFAATIESSPRDTPPDQLHSLLESIRAQTVRAGDIIRRLRSMARHAEPQRIRVDINELIREVVDLHKCQIPIDSLAFHLDDSLPLVNVDRIQIQQVILNLLNNAFEATTEVPVVRRHFDVRTRSIDEAIEVSVSDNGRGLPDDHPERVFDAFFTTKDEGLGIGLAISRSIVEAHGGELCADANDEHGATFRFTLPVVREVVAAG